MAAERTCVAILRLVKVRDATARGLFQKRAVNCGIALRVFIHTMIGTKLAHYEITTHIGSGDMDDVYQATDTKLAVSPSSFYLKLSVTIPNVLRGSNVKPERRTPASRTPS
jgi:hypothetical protein